MAPRKSNERAGTVHFIGIGGIGMSGLARYFLSMHWSVSGSDAARSPMTDQLKKEGVRIVIGHAKGNVPKKADFAIYNRAILPDNPEIQDASRSKVPCIPYAKVLGGLTREYNTIAVTGSHGKSTTTALAGLALIADGLDPTVLVGTVLKEFGGKNLRIGKGAHLVLEADDYGAAFLDYSPAISIVTNIDREHMDFYKNFSNVKRAFLGFMANTRPGGTLILNRDDKALYSLRPRIGGIAKKKGLKVVWYTVHSVHHRDVARVRAALTIPGEHNVSNAMAVRELGRVLGISEKKVLQAIHSYNGAWRRMEYKGKSPVVRGGALVYDDYAHHPTEVKATLQGFRAKFPRATLVCVFQPHQAKRLQLLFKDFVDAFNDVDILVLVPSYQVTGRDTSAKASLIDQDKYTSASLAQAISKKYPKKEVHYLADPKNLKVFLKKVLTAREDSHSPVVLMMGAGNIADHTKDLL